MAVLTAAVTAFHQAFPLTPLRLYVESLGAVIEPVLDGRCTLAILGELAFVPAQFTQEQLLEVPLIHVTSPRHPLAAYGRPIPSSELAKHVQLVLTDRSALSKGKEFGVLSPRTWRLADLGAKHAFLRAGLGWGGMPAERVQSDLARGTLVKIVAQDAPRKGYLISMHAVYRSEAPPGMAARWFIDRLKQGAEAAVVNDSASGRKAAGRGRRS
jgi:DNA-binding transcriptional LysR family regulator